MGKVSETLKHTPEQEGLIERDVPMSPPEGGLHSAEMGSAYLSALIDSSDDAIVSKNLDGIITGWNKGAERIFGYSAEEVMGKSILMLIPPERAGEEAEILTRIRRGERVEHYETVRMRKDGARFDVSVTISPVKDASGRIIGASKIGRDITVRKQAEEAFREAEARFRSTIRQITDYAIFSMDTTGAIKTWNKGCKKVLGYDEAEFLTMHAKQLFVPEDKAAHIPEKELKTAAEEGAAGNDRWMMRKNGERFWASGTTTALYDSAHKHIGFTKVMRDLTQDREAKEELKRSVDRFRFLSDAARHLLETGDPVELLKRVFHGLSETFGFDCYFHFAVERQRTYLELRACGGVPDDSVRQVERVEFGQGICGTAARDMKPVIVEDVQGSKRPIAEIVRSWGITAYACYPLIVNNRLLGTLSFGTRRYNSFTPEVTSVMRALSDLVAMAMARKRVEERLAERARLLDLSRDAIIVLDPQRRVVYWNQGAQDLYGWTEKEARGKNPHEMLHSSFPEPVDAIREKFEREDYWEGEVGQRARDGRVFTVLARWSMARNEDGQPAGALQTHTDITERKRIEQELSKAHQDLSDYARNLELAVSERTAHLEQTIAELEGVSYSLSHDMRAPLRTIQSFSQIVLAEAGDKLGALEKDLLQKSISAADRLDRLIQDVLIYTRVARGPVNLKPVDVERLLRQVIAERPELQQPQAEIEIEIPIEPVLGHEAHLTQCITNLLDNGIKFVAPGVKPRVHVRSERRKNRVRLWFEDNGIGIPRDAQERIFGIFQRIHDEKAYPGTGIGLAIVRKAAERMGGTAGVESEPGKGSRFWVELLRAK